MSVGTVRVRLLGVYQLSVTSELQHSVHTHCNDVRFHVLTAASMKMTFIALMIVAVCIFETSVYFNETIRHYIPESCNLHFVTLFRLPHERHHACAEDYGYLRRHRPTSQI
jgi:hypothetical protein